MDARIARLSRRLQDKLEKEEKIAKVNQLKLQNQWRAIMRKSQFRSHYSSYVAYNWIFSLSFQPGQTTCSEILVS